MLLLVLRAACFRPHHLRRQRRAARGRPEPPVRRAAGVVRRARALQRRDAGPVGVSMAVVALLFHNECTSHCTMVESTQCCSTCCFTSTHRRSRRRSARSTASTSALPSTSDQSAAAAAAVAKVGTDPDDGNAALGEGWVNRHPAPAAQWLGVTQQPLWVRRRYLQMSVIWLSIVALTCVLMSPPMLLAHWRARPCLCSSTPLLCVAPEQETRSHMTPRPRCWAYSEHGLGRHSTGRCFDQAATAAEPWGSALLFLLRSTPCFLLFAEIRTRMTPRPRWSISLRASMAPAVASKRPHGRQTVQPFDLSALHFDILPGRSRHVRPYGASDARGGWGAAHPARTQRGAALSDAGAHGRGAERRRHRTGLLPGRTLQSRAPRTERPMWPVFVGMAGWRAVGGERWVDAGGWGGRGRTLGSVRAIMFYCWVFFCFFFFLNLDCCLTVVDGGQAVRP